MKFPSHCICVVAIVLISVVHSELDSAENGDQNFDSNTKSEVSEKGSANDIKMDKTAQEKYEFDERGYLIFCLCMGRYLLVIC